MADNRIQYSGSSRQQSQKNEPTTPLLCGTLPQYRFVAPRHAWAALTRGGGRVDPFTLSAFVRVAAREPMLRIRLHVGQVLSLYCPAHRDRTPVDVVVLRVWEGAHGRRGDALVEPLL